MTRFGTRSSRALAVVVTVVAATGALTLASRMSPLREREQALPLERVDDIHVAGAHPRVWLTPERVARLREAAARGSKRWERVRDAADAALRATDREAQQLPPLGLAYQVTGNAAYCRRARDIMRWLDETGVDLSGDHYYGYRFELRDVVAGFDWCFAALDDADRRAIAKWLMDRADQVWPETNPSRTGGWGLDQPANNYFWGFLMTWPAALAAWGHDPAHGRASGENRPNYHLSLAMTKWRRVGRPMLDSWGSGGVFPEGTNYDAMITLARLLDAHFTATGTNLATEPGFRFVADSVLWRIHSTTPTRDFVYPLGDQPRVSLAELSSYDRQRMLPLVRLLSGTDRARWAQYWLNTITPSETVWPWVVAWEFLDYDEKAPATDYTQTFPLSYFAPGAGVLVARSDWSADATYFGIWAGPVRESHQAREANGFKIWKGSWLAGDANIWSHSGILGETWHHNTVTIGGRAQMWVEPTAAAPEDGASWKAAEDTREYVVFAGQAARAYASPRALRADFVRDYERQLIYLRSEDAFVVRDRVRTDRPAAVTWHLHSQSGFRVSGPAWSTGNDRWTLDGISLAPRGSTLTVQPVNESAAGTRSSVRLDATSPAAAQTFLLNVVRLRRASSAPAVIATLTDAVAADALVVGNWLVAVVRDSDAGVQVEYQAPVGALHHLVVGLRPSRQYQVVSKSPLAVVMRQLSLPSTTAGVIRIDPMADERAFVITPTP